MSNKVKARIDGINQLREALRSDTEMQEKFLAAFPKFAKGFTDPRSEEWATMDRFIETDLGVTKRCGVTFGPDAECMIINC